MDFFVEESSKPNKKEIENSFSQKKMKRLSFLSTGTKKYKFTLEGEMKLNVMLSQTKTETSWLLQCKDISDDGYIFDLLSYDTVLKECNSDGFKELFLITNQFKKLYDEIKFQTDKEGKLLRVLNPEKLTEKWQRLKAETIQYFGDETTIDKFFAVNDEEFAKQDFLNKLINEVEFFMFYLQLAGYGKKFNSWATGEIKKDNAFRTGVIIWDLSFSGKNEIIPGSPLGKVVTKGSFGPNKKWLEKAYGEIPFIKLEELEPQFTIEGNYTFYNKSGWLKSASIELNEVVHKNLLYHKMKYIIEEID